MALDSLIGITAKYYWLIFIKGIELSLKGYSYPYKVIKFLICSKLYQNGINSYKYGNYIYIFTFLSLLHLFYPNLLLDIQQRFYMNLMNDGLQRQDRKNDLL